MNIIDVTSGLNAMIMEYDDKLEDLRVVVTSAGALNLLQIPGTNFKIIVIIILT